MDQGDSTASFGSNNSMATGDSTNVAMVGQTVVSDLMSSVGESPAPSSESARSKKGHTKGKRSRSIGQNNGVIVSQVICKIWVPMGNPMALVVDDLSCPLSRVVPR